MDWFLYDNGLRLERVKQAVLEELTIRGSTQGGTVF